MNRREEIIQNIKDIGQSIIDNAEKIANDYKYVSDLTITCYPLDRDCAAHIVVTTEFAPEKHIERL